ncbi:hypothetical protein IHE55_01050 [Streptomyces pactum]|uniref:Proline dehydrogenase n=1 Tax=Streptomyces pactum TaxID=68249 RepID=A0ABS0NE41_9ACTN|nr:hypothetical protein [Streptomyces pactum]MBH5333463.1 hypothetical protein [Streptomyces pactum]
MNWLTLISTLLGAVVGVGTTLLADRARWGRERQAQTLEHRRALYGEFLTTLNLAQESLFAVSYGRHPAELTRDLAARAAFGSHQVYAVRERLVLSGCEPVVAAADAAFHRLKEFRDVVGSGAAPTSPEVMEAITAYAAELRTLRHAMRDDLGEPRLEIDISN